MRILLILFLCLSLLSCGNHEKPTANTEISKSASAEWLGEWQRSERQNNAYLNITHMGDNNLTFTLQGQSGGNMGELEGTAVVIGNIATYYLADEYDTCKIIFEILGDSVILVDQPSGICGAGMGVYYSGEYRRAEKNTNDSEQEQETLLSIGIFDSEQQDSTFKALTGESYDLFLNSTQLTSEEEDLDSLGATVTASGVRGLFTQMENIIMTDSAGHIWAAVLDDEKVVYYTNVEAYNKKLPRTIEQWRSRFEEYPIIYKQ